MNAVTKTEKPSPTVQFREQLTRQEQEIATALPPHMPVERFMRVVLTAVNGNPDLLSADRRSLFESAMKAAQDGLLPDGRDGALVIFSKKVSWMPMVSGILKKIRNSGELLSISAYVAYENDHFEYSLGDEESITHKPCLDENRGKPRLVYAIAKTKDGGIYREIMTLSEVEKVRNVSRAKNNGPWKDWWDEMAKKTVIRRLAKRLPMSSDLDDLIRRDDDLYDFQGKRADMDGMHRSLAGPTVAERLKAAQNSAEDHGGEREGFSGDFIEHEASDASTTPNSDDSPLSSTSSDEAGESPSPADTDGDGSAPSQEPSPSEEEREPGQDEDEADITAKERDILIRYARSMLDAGADQKKDRAQIEKMHGVWKAGDFKNFGQAALEKAKSIFDSAQAIARNDASFDAAVSFFEEMLDAEGQIGGQNNG